MKSLLYCFIIFISSLCHAQYWAPEGAIWHYDQDHVFGLKTGMKIHESIGDTMINGDSSQIILETSVYINPVSGDTIIGKHPFFTKFDSNRVYYFYEEANAFRLLYDFNLTAGDTLRSFCREAALDSSVTVVIDSVSSIVINQDTLKVQHVSQIKAEECSMWGNIIERIGWVGYMFPQHSWVDPPEGGPLRCYEDSIIGLYRHNSSYSCDFITSDKIAIYNPNKLIVYPNPTTNKLFIEIDLKQKKDLVVELFDFTGKRLKTSSTEIEKESALGRTIYEIDMKKYSAGHYFIRLSDTSGKYSESIKIQKVGR